MATTNVQLITTVSVVDETNTEVFSGNLEGCNLQNNAIIRTNGKRYLITCVEFDADNKKHIINVKTIS